MIISMIYCRRHHCLFVHIQKTGGSSISHVLYHDLGGRQIGNYHSRMQDVRIFFRPYTFAFVRNPWDRLVSWYNMMQKKGVHNSLSRYLLENSNNFSEFLRLTEVIHENEYEPKRFFSLRPYLKSIAFNQVDYVTNRKGHIVADFIGRFETLQDDFDVLMGNLGLPPKDLPRLNVFKHADYRKYYTSADVDFVAKLFKKDIDYFQYTFE